MIGLGSFIFSFLSVFTVNRLGRWIHILVGCIGCGLGLILAIIGYSSNGNLNNTPNNYVFCLGIFTMIAFFSMFYGPISWLYTSEILPSQWMGYSAGSSWFATVLISMTITHLLELFGSWVFGTFFLLMMLITIPVIPFIKETKGRSI